MDISTRHVVHNSVALGDGLGFPLDEEYPFVAEGTRPVRVNLKLTSDVLRDHQFLRFRLVEEAHDEVALLVGDQQLVPLVRLEAQALECVVLQELQPLVRAVAHHGDGDPADVLILFQRRTS